MLSDKHQSKLSKTDGMYAKDSEISFNK